MSDNQAVIDALKAAVEAAPGNQALRDPPGRAAAGGRTV